jgi:cysteinyl-tRNA synthetase
MHNALLRLAGDNSAEEKMSRHVGNTLWVKDALERHSADEIRLYLLSTHYRTPLAWTDADVDAAARGLERLRGALTLTPAAAPPLTPPAVQGENNALAQIANETREKFIAAMDNDFGTAQAIASLYDLVREINRARDGGATSEAIAPAQDVLRELANVLGLSLEQKESSQMVAAPFIELLIQVRKDLRAAKQYALADKVRDDLAKLGVTLEDGPQGTTWKSK